MYEIKEEGFEYNGFKLGQMTNKGKIIGFEIGTNSDLFIATTSGYTDCNDAIKNSEFASVVLSGYEDYGFEWSYQGELSDETIPTIQIQLNIIQQIRKAINGHNVKLEFFQEEFCVSLYDSEIPICWDKQNGVYLLTKTMSGNIYSDMVVEILDVIKIIESNLEWFKECMQND